MISSKNIRERVKDVEEFLKAEYKLNHEENERDWKAYEQDYSHRLKEAMRQLRPLIDESVSTIKIETGPGRPHQLTLNQRVTLLLLKELFGESNRMMAAMLDLFSILSGIDVSYKTVERLYSDPEVDMALHNLHLLILRKKGVNNIDASGDGTGYSLSISQHYASETQRHGDATKESEGEGKKAFIYSFKMIDITSQMYVAYGTAMKSEKQAFEKAMIMREKTGISIRSVRLDRYYSFSSYVERFGDAKVYVFPRKNATLKGSWEWKRTMTSFVEETEDYLEEYYQREHSENGFSVDKRRMGWDIAQRRADRIDTADFCIVVWHNIFRIGAG